MKWRPIKTAPKDGTKVLAVCAGEVTIAWYSEAGEDGPDYMGMDAGWWDALVGAVPGRSFGAEDHKSKPMMQPEVWMPMPQTPDEIKEAQSECAKWWNSLRYQSVM